MDIALLIVLIVGFWCVVKALEGVQNRIDDVISDIDDIVGKNDIDDIV